MRILLLYEENICFTPAESLPEHHSLGVDQQLKSAPLLVIEALSYSTRLETPMKC